MFDPPECYPLVRLGLLKDHPRNIICGHLSPLRPIAQMAGFSISIFRAISRL